MKRQRAWLCGFCGGGMVPGGVGGRGPEMCPSVGASALARLIAPMTIRITGNVLPKEKYPPRTWSRRNKTPTVMMTAGPMRPRIMHRRQLQRTRSLIENHPLQRHSRAAHSVAKHQHANANQNQGPRSEEHTSELQSQFHLVCRLLLEKKKN